MSHLPAGPNLPSFLQMMQWVADPFGFLDTCAQRYGDNFTLRLRGSEPFVVVSNPQDIQAILTADATDYDGGKGNELLKPLVGENSILLLDGPRHKRQRKLLMPPFHGERMRGYAQIIIDLAQQVAGQWQPGKPFIVRDAMQNITLQVIMQAVFGLRDGDRYRQLKPLLAGLLNMTGSPLRSSMVFFEFLQLDRPWSPWGRMMQRKQRIETLLQAEIDERRASGDLDREDVLSLMMAARDEAGEPMSDAELRDELLTLLFAGHETTATALAWAFYWIHKLPDVRSQLRQELASLGENPDPTAIARLPYLSAVCNETLRIYPVAFITFPRIAKVPVTVGGRNYDPGTALVPCIYLVHHREDLYPHPQQFQPERFLNRQYSPYELLPFGGGSRRCIGYALAQMEMKLVIATLVSQYDLELVDSKPIKPQRRGVTVAPAGGVKLVMKKQRSPRVQSLSKGLETPVS